MLLSLLLVFSQPMGYAHALTHATALTGLAASQTAEMAMAAPASMPESDPHLSGITKLGFDHSCAQCLAVAQCTAAVDTHSHSFPLLDGVAVVATAAPLALLPLSPCTAYRSRAPPLLSC